MPGTRRSRGLGFLIGVVGRDLSADPASVHISRTRSTKSVSPIKRFRQALGGPAKRVGLALVAGLERLHLFIELRGVCFQCFNSGIMPLVVDRLELSDLVGSRVGSRGFEPFGQFFL